MSTIKDAESKLKDVDSLLTTLTNVLKKHWKVLILLSLIGAGYLVYDYNFSDDEEQQYEFSDDTSNQK